MSQFDDPEGAMPPPDDNPSDFESEATSPDTPGSVRDDASIAPDPIAPDSMDPELGPKRVGGLAEPTVSLDRRVVFYWILSGLLSWLMLSVFLGGAAGFVYSQAAGGGEEAAGWAAAWSYVMPTAVGLSAALLAWTLISPPLAYARWRYSVDSELLLARYGILFIEEKAIPISRLQHVDLYRGFLERMFGLTTLIVFTAGTEGAHFRLPGLTLVRARELRDLILAARGDDVI